MRGLFGCAGRSLRLPALVRQVLDLERLADMRFRRDVIGLDPGPHWLHRDIEPGSGRLTRQAMRRPPNWPDPAG